MKLLSHAFLLILVAHISSFASNKYEVREVSFTCSSKECTLRTQFLNEEALPQYFWEKNDSGLTINFAQTSTILNYGTYQLSNGISLTLSDAKVESTDVLSLTITGFEGINVKENLSKTIYSLSWQSPISLKKLRVSGLKPLKVSKAQISSPVVTKPSATLKEPTSIEPKKTKATSLGSDQVVDKALKNQNSLESFVQSIPDSKLDPTKVFGLKGLKQEMAVIKLANLYADKQKQNIITELTPGQLVTKLENYKKLTKVQVSGKKGYIRTAFIKPSASLTPMDNEKLRKLALSIIEKKKSAPKSSITVDEKQKNESIKIDSIKTAKPDSKIYSYSTFGRKDPFVPYEDEVEEGMNIDAVQVVGIIWEENSPIVIMEEVNGSGATYTLKENDPIQNGKVFKITPDEVTFELTEFGITRRFAMQLPVIQEGGN